MENKFNKKYIGKSGVSRFCNFNYETSLEFWQQSVLLHQDITKNKFVTSIMKKESDKMITIGISILNKHQEKE